MRSNFATPISRMSGIQTMFVMCTRDDPILELFIWKIVRDRIWVNQVVNAIESIQSRKRTSKLMERDGRPKECIMPK
jgi:hypothetical protein